MNKLSFGEKLRIRRCELGMSQNDVAKKMGFAGRSAINKWESNENAVKSDNIERLALVLGVTPSYFFIDDESPEVNEENFPISFETFSNVFASHGISEKDINDLSPDDQEKLFDLIKQFIKSFKKN